MSEEKLLSTAEVATLHGVTKQAVALACKDGRIPARKVGRFYVISEEDAKAYRPLVDYGDRGRVPKKKRGSQ